MYDEFRVALSKRLNRTPRPFTMSAKPKHMDPLHLVQLNIPDQEMGNSQPTVIENVLEVLLLRSPGVSAGLLVAMLRLFHTCTTLSANLHVRPVYTRP